MTLKASVTNDLNTINSANEISTNASPNALWTDFKHMNLLSVQSIYILCKQFGRRSGSKLFDTLIVFLKGDLLDGSLLSRKAK